MQILRLLPEITAEQKYEILITLLALGALIRILAPKIKRAKHKISRKYSQYKTRKKLSRRRFRADGSYWDDEKKRWIEPDFPQKPK